MTRITTVLATVLSLALTPLAAQQTDCDGWSNLDYWEAATVDTVSECLNAGADVSARAEITGNTPLMFASAISKNPAVLEVLLEAGADVNARDAGGKTPLFLAVSLNSMPEVVTFLLNAGANVNARNQQGNTPLHGKPFGRNVPYFFNNTSALSVLLDAGADINATNEDGWTPLHTAAEASDNPALVTALLDAGADGTAVNEDRQTPFDLAKNNDALAGTDAYWALNDARFE